MYASGHLQLAPGPAIVRGLFPSGSCSSSLWDADFLGPNLLTSWSHSTSQSRLVLTTPSIRHQGAQSYQVLDTHFVNLLRIPPLECFLSSFLKGRFMLHRQRLLPNLFPSPIKVSFTFIELVLTCSHVHGCVPCFLQITALLFVYN